MVEEISTTTRVSPDGVELPMELSVPSSPRRLVVFFPPWGRGLVSENDQYVAERVAEQGIATVRMNGLTETEKTIHENEVDWRLLTTRLLAMTDAALERDAFADLPLGYYGTSTGAAPALRGAYRNDRVDAVVTRGGRVDFAPRALDDLDAPVRLFVGSEDEPFLTINRRAHDRLADSDLQLLDGAGHSGLSDAHLNAVADGAVEWFDAAD